MVCNSKPSDLPPPTSSLVGAAVSPATTQRPPPPPTSSRVGAAVSPATTQRPPPPPTSSLVGAAVSPATTQRPPDPAPHELARGSGSLASYNTTATPAPHELARGSGSLASHNTTATPAPHELARGSGSLAGHNTTATPAPHELARGSGSLAGHNTTATPAPHELARGSGSLAGHNTTATPAPHELARGSGSLASYNAACGPVKEWRMNTLTMTTCFLLIAAQTAADDSPINPVPRAAKDTMVHGWTFDAGNEGWTAENQCSLAVRDGTLRVQSTGDDPFMHCPVNLPGGDVELRLRIRSRVGGTGSVFWTTDKSPARGEEKRADFRMPLMAFVTDRGSVAMTWRDMSLQPVYATPNFIDALADHRMALRGRSIGATIRVDPQPLEEAILWAVQENGLPDLPPAPRSAEEQASICLAALNGPLRTADGWGHCLQPNWIRLFHHYSRTDSDEPGQTS